MKTNHPLNGARIQLYGNATALLHNRKKNRYGWAALPADMEPPDSASTLSYESPRIEAHSKLTSPA